MWLGISLVAVFDFLSTAFDLLKFPFRNFHVKKTRVRRINLQKRNKNVNKKKPKFWSNYLTNVFRDSMLSGVPQILLAESKVKKCVLTLVFLSCIVGYLYQSSEFLRLYWKYETVVDIHLTNSNLTELPSITFCNYDGSNITKICGELKPDWCFPLSKEPELPEKVCECLPQRYCENGTFKDRKVLPFYGYGEISKLPPDERLKYIQDLNDVIRSCSFLVHGNQPEDCDFSYFRKSSVPTHNIYGFLSGCYTLNTVFGRPNAKPSVVTSSGTIVLNISIDESEYIHLYHPPEGLISFHNPYHIVNPHVKGFTLSMKTKRHTFHLKKVVRKLLPYPYDTHCTDYLSRWKERGGKGPINNEDCYNECQLNISLEKYGCLDLVLRPYSMESIFCTIESLVISDNGTFATFDADEFKQKTDECAKKNCGPACYEESYQVIKDLEDVQNEGKCNKHSKDNKQKEQKSNLIHNITVIINLNGMTTTTYSYRPKVETVEFWSNIGGYIGIWLGISLIALYDFFDTIIGILFHLCQKLQIRAKRFVVRILKR
ncbi:acid-sensing ion channel 1A-like isoform X2 [Parasteatoda tepidariorum]